MMTTRPIVSYDDISLPYEQSDVSQSAQHSPPNRPPPSKKRKWSNNQKGKQHRPQHRDDPARPQESINYGGSNAPASKPNDDDEEMEDEGTGEGEDESRQLSHEEIWDDSALIDAWNAAMEEYEAYNGPDKGWKNDPVNRSSLWYNVPPESNNVHPSNSKKLDVHVATSSSIPSVLPSERNSELDSQPLNFDTFVPTHDPSLDVPHPPSAENYIPSTQAGPMASQDEAFSRALNAMYWGGYWTAIYQCHRHRTQNSSMDEAVNETEEEEQGNDDADKNNEGQGEDEFVSTQR